MTTSPTNTYPNRPIFDDYEIKENTPVPLASQGLSSQSVSAQEQYIQDVSVTVDCLRVPIQHLSLETLNEANESDKSGFYALAQNIFQFSIADREEIYNHLQLDEGEKDDLEDLHDSDSTAFQKELKKHIQSFAESVPLGSVENVLSQLADRLEINLVILKQQQGKIEVVQDQFSTATCYEWDHNCFRSELCVAVAEHKRLFKKSKDRTVQIECSSQSAAKIREVYAELAQIRKTILAIHNHEKKLEELNDDPYKLWYEKHISEEVLNTQAALRELSQAEIDIQDFSENVLKQELRNYPLAVIREKLPTQSIYQAARHDFEHEGQKYLIKPTLAGEVSALHALLGKETPKGYAYPAGNTNSSVKEYFTDQLKRALKSTKFPTVKEAFAQIIIPYMNDPENGSIFKELCQPSNRKDIFDLWNQKFNTGDQNQRDRFTKQKDFILSCPDILQSYTTFINQPGYWLGTEEIRLAAHLFNKKVQIVASIEERIAPTEPVMNSNGNGELVVIHYDKSNHFEHCIPVKESSFENRQQTTKHKDLGNYDAINLKKLQESSLVTYGALALCKALDNILEFIDHKQLDDTLFTILYGDRSRKEVSEEYDGVLNGVTQSLGIQETWSLDDEQIIDKITSLIWNLQSQLPKGLRGNRAFVLDPRFAKLREIASFIQKKKFVEELAQQIAGKKPSEIKAILRKSQKIQDLNKVKEIASELQTSSVDEIKESLFREFYKGDYNEELEGFTKALHEIGQNLSPKKIWSINDENILDEINKILLLHTQEKNREYHEKSLDQLCSEYAELNGIDSSTINAIKAHILNIRLSIEDLKQGKTLPNDTNQQYPVALIAEICVKIEETFGDMLRDTQLLAILSMLDSSNPKGALSQVKTGEGKSYIIAALAIVKNKQGHEVDVITSSATLAKRDLEKFKDFYQQQFGISSAHNCDSDVGMMANPCYQPNSIVYGTTASFEGDSLRSEFYQADTFNGRQRGIAIVDEADSALLDKASWLCQISDSVAGMSTVRPLLYYIWALVLKKVDEAKERKFETQEAYDTFLQEIKEEIAKNTGDFFSGGDQSFVIPQHLREFAEYRISYWVDSALNAIFYTHDREYNACKVLKKITPIDYANTGEWEKDVQWEDGLHQFLQMKNGMGVETETLTKSFMSNYTLINKYNSVYGLSGTLGEEEESQTFQGLYGVATRKIPKFKTCHYEEKPAWISSGKEQWLDSLYTDVVKDGLEEESSPQDALPSNQTERFRSSLIICKTIADVREVEEHFKKKGINPSDIVTYTKGDEDTSKIKEATKGKIIIATNLSGRGTDIDASSIEEAGGLHVIFSFLPGNRRIQDQGFGRTARKGLSGTARLIIKQEEIKEHHLQKEETPLLDICNNISNSNLKSFKISYENNLWEVESDSFNNPTRELRIKRGGSSPETKTVRLSYAANPKMSETDRKQQKIYNTIEVDGIPLDNPKTLQACSFNLTYDSIMNGRNQREQGRLSSLISDEKGSLIKKQALFEGFQSRVHNISQGFTVDPRLSSISSSLLDLYKSYVLDEWAIFLDRVSKNLKLPRLEYFDYARNLSAMIEKNDLYKMQYMNASIDVDNEEIRSEADAFYAQRGQKVDITGGFAWYNRVFVTLKKDKHNISEARSYLNKAKDIFEKGEQYEKGILKIQHALTSSDENQPSDEDMEGTPMLRLILTMKALIKRNLEELDKLAKDYSKLKVSFTNAYDLKEKPSSPTEKKDDDEKGYTIPDDLMQEAIKLGLKGPLKLEGEGDLWKAIVCAIVCVVIAIAAIAAIALSGGAAAPLVALVGGKVAFGIIAGAVVGAAISGAINSIKGAVNGDFSASSLGKDVLTGLITGAIGGGVAAGLSGLATGALQTATTLTRVAINAGIGAASGIAAGSAGYLIGSGLHGREITWEGLGKAVLQGAVGGALGGGFMGLEPHGTNSIRWAMLTGTLGSTAGNAVIQGIQIAMGDRKNFDGFELLVENGLQAGIMAGAQKYAAKQALKQNQRMVPYNEGANGGGNTGEFDYLPQNVRERVAGMSERLQNIAKLAARNPNTPEARHALRLLNNALERNGQAPIDIVGAEPQQPARNIPQRNQQQRNGVGQSGEANNQQAANLRQSQRMEPRPQAGRNHQTKPHGGIVAQQTPKVNDSFKPIKNLEQFFQMNAKHPKVVNFLEKSNQASREQRIRQNTERLDRMEPLIGPRKRANSLDGHLGSSANLELAPQYPEALNLEISKLRRFDENLMRFNRMAPSVVLRDELYSSQSRMQVRNRRGSLDDLNPLQKPILFQRGRAWDNTPPKAIEKYPDSYDPEFFQRMLVEESVTKIESSNDSVTLFKAFESYLNREEFLSLYKQITKDGHCQDIFEAFKSALEKQNISTDIEQLKTFKQVSKYNSTLNKGVISFFKKTSVGIRLRSEKDLQVAPSYIKNAFNKISQDQNLSLVISHDAIQRINDFIANADWRALERLHYIINESYNKRMPELEYYSLVYSANRNPKNIYEFVDFYQFGKHWCEQFYSDLNKNQKIPRDQAALQAMEKLKEYLPIDAHEEFSSFFEAAKEIVPTSAYQLKDINITYNDIVNICDSLNFGSPSSLAYHAMKHQEIYDVKETPCENLNSYIEKSRDCIRKAASEAIQKGEQLQPIPGQFGNDSLKFKFSHKYGETEIKVFLTLNIEKKCMFINTCM